MLKTAATATATSHHWLVFFLILKKNLLAEFLQQWNWIRKFRWFILLKFVCVNKKNWKFHCKFLENSIFLAIKRLLFLNWTAFFSDEFSSTRKVTPFRIRHKREKKRFFFFEYGDNLIWIILNNKPTNFFSKCLF